MNLDCSLREGEIEIEIQRLTAIADEEELDEVIIV